MFVMRAADLVLVMMLWTTVAVNLSSQAVNNLFDGFFNDSFILIISFKVVLIVAFTVYPEAAWDSFK